MHIKWLKHGKGDARKATAYVLAERYHQGIERAGVEVLRGNPEQVAEVANALDFSRRYSSGVISWAKDDAPTPAQIQQTVDEFAAVAFAGMDADRISWTAVQHIEQNGAIHVHILVARVDLETGKAFNPAPPGWQKAYDPLRDALNFENRWARPDDPARARLVQPGHQALIDAAALRKGLTTPSAAKEQITQWLTSRMEAGIVTDRADVRASLAEIGEITRESADYISVKPAGFDKAIRLKGAIYGEEFSGAVLAAGREIGERPAVDRSADERAAKTARRELGAVIERRAEFNKGRYGQSEQSRNKEPDRGQDADRGTEPSAIRRDREADKALVVAHEVADAGDAGRLPHYLSNDLGILVVFRSVDNLRHYGGEREALDKAGAEQRGLAAVPQERTGRHDVPLDTNRVSEGKNGERRIDVFGISSGLSPFARAAGAGSAADRNIHFQPWRSDGTDYSGLRASRFAGRERMPALRQQRVSAGQQVAGDSLLQRFVPRFGDLHHRLHSIFADLRGWYDRTRSEIGQRIRGVIESVQIGRADLVTASAGLEQAVGRAEQRQHKDHRQLDAAAGRLEQAVSAAEPREREANAGIVRTVHAANVRLDEGTRQLERQADRACGKLKMDRDDELTRFKSVINLVEYAECNGYQIDKKEISRASTVMRNGDDKIIVATDADGHGVYFSIRDDRDNGSIIDFVQKRTGANLGQVRKVLRPWIGGTAQAGTLQRRPEAERPSRPLRSNADRQQVLLSFSKMLPVEGHHDYLQKERKIDAKTLNDARFSAQIRVDARNNAVFPHYDRNGLCGYELRGVPTIDQNGKSFAKGGEKALWHSSNLGTASRIVIVESAINALSHAQIKRDMEAGYVSIGGCMSDKQRDLVAGLLEKAAERGVTIVLSMDKDEPGRVMEEQIRKLAPDGLKIERQEPVHGKDWNEELKQSHEKVYSRECVM